MDHKLKTNGELLKKISELQKENEVLKAQNKSSLYGDQLELILQSAGEGILRIDIDGNHTFVNQKAACLLGYEPEDLIGRNSHSTWHYNLPDGSPFPSEKCPIYFTLKDGKTHKGESYFWRKDGSGFYVDYTSMPIFDNDSVIAAVVTFFDITERKIAYEEILKLQRAVESSGEAIFITDLNGLITYINPEFINLYGYTADEVIGKKTPRILKSGVVSPENYKYFWAAILNREVVRGELLNKTKDGRLITIEGSANPILNDQKEIIGFIGIQHDITSRKRTEEKLAEEQYMINSLLNNHPDHIYFKDLESRFIRINKSHAQSLGLTDPEQAAGKTDFDFFTEEYARLAYKDEQAIIQTEQLLTREERLVYANRPDSWVFTTKLPFRNKEGKIIGTFGISRDITKRKRTELKNQLIYEITHGVATTSNLDELLKLIHHSLEKVVYAENCFVALHDQETGLFSFAYHVDQFDPIPLPTTMGKSCTAYVFRTDKPLLLNQQIFDQLKEQNEVELVGSPSPSWIGIPLQTPSKVIGILVLQHYEKENIYSESDVKFLVSIGSQIAISIERKKAEEEIKLKNEQLQAINAEKDKFFSILAHDLQGPLSTFVAATQIITEEIQTMNIEEIKDITGSMKTSAANIYSLLENLLEWSRLKWGGLDFAPEKLNLKKKIGVCIDVLSEYARNKGIEIAISIPDELEVFADNHMFDTVIRNLVSNAIKFTPVGGKVGVTADYKSDRLIEVKISDSGIGMTPELKGKLFLLHEKTNRQGTAGEPSTGLGLLLCKEFIEKHGGEIWVDSEEGRGSTFRFTIKKQ